MSAADPESPPPPDYATHRDARLVTLTSLSPLEAELARTKLESQGIPAFVEGAHLANMHVLAFPDATIKVSALDLDRAREVLAAPAPAADADSDDEYVDEPWRCPKCHRKSLEFLPRSRVRKSIRTLFFILLALPLVMTVLENVALLPKDLSEQIAPITAAAALITMFLALFLIFVKRAKYCKSCDWNDRVGDKC